MKLVLLPGMDGTGDLFEPLLNSYQGEYLVLPLPQYGPQDHQSLAKVISEQLPEEEFVLLAESFAGGIVPELLRLNSGNIKSVIFAASFLSSPNKPLLTIAQYLPIKWLASAPFTSAIHRGLFLGNKSSKELIKKFTDVIQSVPQLVIKNRLKAMQKQAFPDSRYDIPAVYIQAKQDRLVSHRKANEISKMFPNLKLKRLEGPHFILQSKAEEAASLVANIVASKTKSKGKP